MRIETGRVLPRQVRRDDMDTVAAMEADAAFMRFVVVVDVRGARESIP